MIINLNLIKQKQNWFLKPKNNIQTASVPYSLKTGLNADKFEKCASKKEISFKGIDCSNSEFVIKDILNLRCPYCGYIMLNDEQRSQFVHDVYDKKGLELVSALEKYEDESVFVGQSSDKNSDAKKGVYRPQRQAVVDAIKDLAIENPSCSLEELIRLGNENKPYLEILVKDQMKIVHELEDYIIENVNSKDEMQDLKRKIDVQKNQILNVTNKRFRRKEFIYAIANSCQDAAVQKGLDDIVEKLPTSQDSVESFFVKYSNGNYSSKDIAAAIIKTNEPTTEHILPKVAGGRDNTGNFIADCLACNNTRSDTDFYTWQEKNPEFQEQMQDYLNTVQEELDRKIDIVGYDSYIDDIIAIFSKLSKGEIKLVRPIIAQNDEQKKELQRRKDILDDFSRKIKETDEEITAKTAEMRRMKTCPCFDDICELDIVNEKLAQLQSEIDTCENKHEVIRLQDRYNQYQKRKTQLNRKMKNYVSGITMQMSILYDILFKVAQLRSELSKIKKREGEKQKILGEIQACDERIRALEAKNPYREVSYEDRKDYKQYVHNQELLDEIERMEQGFLKGRKNRSKSNKREVLELSKSSLQFRNDTLREKPGVMYLIKLDVIESLKKTNKKRLTQLQDCEYREKRAQKLNDEIESLLNNRSEDDINKNIEELKAQKDLYTQTRHYNEIKLEVDRAIDCNERNKQILASLKNIYRSLETHDFNVEIMKIYV